MCRHGTRLSVQLPSVSGTDSKLGLAVVRLALQSAPEPPALDSPPVSKHTPDMWQFLQVFDVQWTWPLTFSTESWQSTYLCAEELGTFISILIFLHFYRAMHVVLARYCYRNVVRPSVCPSVRPSVTLTYRGHIGSTSSSLEVKYTNN